MEYHYQRMTLKNLGFKCKLVTGKVIARDIRQAINSLLDDRRQRVRKVEYAFLSIKINFK